MSPEPKLTVKFVNVKTAHRTVEELSSDVKDRDVLSVRPTSLLSKLAFCCQPEVFSPYDSLARKALRDDYGIKDHKYADYMEAIFLEKERVADMLRSRGITATSLRYKGKVLGQNLFELRATDKWLMLRGGFKAERMRKEFSTRDFGADPY